MREAVGGPVLSSFPTPKQSLILFFSLATGFSWLCWFGAPALAGFNTAVPYFLVRLGLFGPGLAALVLARRSSPVQSLSHGRVLARGLLFLTLFGLTLFLLTWQKMLGNSVRFTPQIFVADALLALLVGLLCTARWSKYTAVGDLLRPLYQWRVSPRWYFFALALFPALAYSTILFMDGGGTSFSRFILNPIGEENWRDLALLVVLSALVGGPLGEEIGWRGFALPRLQQLYSDTTSSFLLGGVWALWHLPLYLTGVYNGRVDDILARFFWTIPLAFLFTYLHRNTKGSIFLAVLLHVSFNVSPFSLHPLNVIFLLILARWVQVVGEMNRPAPLPTTIPPELPREF
ncbi:MAG: CPBP family intramembrane metalloprotease [Anaerolineales bacterium]|nr:CPBP family intramembrane metalloprotease [Anaerolineales bacterium]